MNIFETITNSKFDILKDLQNLKLLPFTFLPDNTYFFVFFVLFFVLTTVTVTIFQSYLSVNGIFYILFFSLSSLVMGIIQTSPTMFKDGSQLIFEIKLYSVYLPSATINLFFSLDKLSSAFANLVLIISITALLYARIYLNGDPNITDFFVKLMWFVLSMFFLVMSKNCFVLYFFWESIGITSMWLINYNSQRVDTLKSALKAFIFNKISDLTLFSSLLIGFLYTNTTNIDEWEIKFFLSANNTEISTSHIFWFSLFLVIAACIKSAQLGFHIWLPDSMDAPVPASALIHSATLVSAGVYLLMRFNIFLSFSGFLEYTAVIGAFTAAYGGLAAAAQTDLKKSLAYSTISHCGFLFVLASLSMTQATVLYLFLHGFFKALSFICVGELIRNANGSQDINKNGSFYFISPSLYTQLLISMANLCGLPLFFGYSFKVGFQKALLISSFLNIFIITFLLIGLLSSVFYFIRIFWATSFHFKKNNFKIHKEINKPGLYCWCLPIKTPKALFVIFWFIYGLSLFCVFYMFTLHKDIFITPFSDFFSIGVGYHHKVTVNAWQLVNYLFLFYNFFFWVVWLIWNSFSPKRFNSDNSLFKLSLWCFFLLTVFFLV